MPLNEISADRSSAAVDLSQRLADRMPRKAYPGDLLYHSEHSWARLGNIIATVGVTSHAQELLGKVRRIDLPLLGQEITQGRPYARMESSDRSAAIIAPLSGQVIEVNTAVNDDPTLINTMPFDSGWLVRISVADPEERKNLVEFDSYRRIL